MAKQQAEVLGDFLERYRQSGIHGSGCGNANHQGTQVDWLNLTYQDAPGSPVIALNIRPILRDGRPVIVISEEAMPRR